MASSAVHSISRVTLLLTLACLLARRTEAQIYRLAELRTDQIAALDREKTAILIPGGILEEHGPYLPSYADGYASERLTSDLATAIAQRPGWAAVVFPVIPLGSGGANEIGAKYSFPGTYAVRPATLRAVFMDLATEFGEQGFRWIFVINRHGGPSHNRALDQACDYFRDAFGGHMVNLTGLLLEPSPVKAIMAANLPASALAEDGFSVHAYLAEHAEVMALRPDLVPSTVTTAPSITGKDFPDLMRIARAEGWPGYFGAPRYASAELGRALLEARNREFVALALRIMDGLDEQQVPRYAPRVWKAPGIATVMDDSAKRDAAVERRQRLFAERANSAFASAPEQTEHEAEVRAVHQAYWRSLVVEGSDAALERFYADDFTYLGLDGVLIDKARLKARMKRNQLTNLELNDDLKRVSIYGDVALISGHSTSVGRDKGQEHHTKEGYVEVWVKRGEGWKLVAEQITPQR